MPVVVKDFGAPSAKVKEEPSCANARRRMEVEMMIVSR